MPEDYERERSETKDANWLIYSQDQKGTRFDDVMVTRALLMDLRDELRAIRSELRAIRNVAQCHNATRIPNVLDQIAENTRKVAPFKKRKSHKR